MKTFVVGLGLALATFAWCQAGQKVKITFAEAGDREVWIQSTADRHKLPEMQSATGTAIELTTSANPATTSAFVHDRKTGDVAERTVAEIIKAGQWKVAAADFKRRFRINFRLETDGKPVAAATLKASSGKETMTVLVAPGERGVAQVVNVPFGDLKVEVTYKTTSGEQQTTAPQTFPVKAGMGPETETVMSLPGATPDATPETTTPPPAKSPAGQPAEAPPSSTGTSPLSTIFNLLIGLAIVGGLGYGIYMYVRKNQDQVQTALKAAGISPADPADPTGGAPLPAAPAPIKPIVLDPSSSPDPAPMAASTAAIPKNPRLVGADGSLILVGDAGGTVGRDASANFVVSGDSGVSRQHAEITVQGDDIVINDLGSTNGTFVNGVRLSAPVTLRPGDTVIFGAASFRYED